MRKKQISATLYLESRISKINHQLIVEDSPDGYLFSHGRYPTKILPEDLPEWFIYGYLYKRHGYISAKGVKHLIYSPNYFVDNHLYKDDLLAISYDKVIKPTKSARGFSWFSGYDHIISGALIVRFVEATKKHSGYNVDEIQKELTKKSEWYYELNPR